MTLETVVEDIREEARGRAETILAEAEAEAAEIVEEAEAAAEEIVAERKRAVDRRIDQERDQRLASAKLEAKQRRLEAKRDLLARVRADVEDELATLGDDRRRDLTATLLEDALEEFDPDAPLRVHCRSTDEDLVDDLLEAADHDLDVAGVEVDLDVAGGVVVESHASRIRVDNTFDSVLEEVWSDVLKDASERLFQDR